MRESTKFVSFVKDMKKSKIEHQNRLRNSKREKELFQEGTEESGHLK